MAIQKNILSFLIVFTIFNYSYGQVKRTAVDYNNLLAEDDSLAKANKIENLGPYISSFLGSRFTHSTNGTYYNNYNHTTNYGSVAYKNISLGKGFDFGMAIGKKLNEVVSIELAGSYLISNPTIVKSGEVFNTYSIEYKENFSSQFINFNPSIVFESPSKNWILYGKVGLVTGFTKSFYSLSRDSVSNGYWIPYNETIKITEKGSFPLGYNASIGMKKNAGYNRFVFIELCLNHVSQRYKNASMTSYTIDGEEYVSRLNVIQREFEFVDELNSTMNQDPNSSRKLLKNWTNFSTIGLKFGIQFFLR